MADKFLKTLKLPGIDKPYKIPQTAADIGAAPAGYGLGDSELVNVDIDYVCTPGWYCVSQTMTIGGISANYWYIHVSAYGTGNLHCVQEIYPVLSNGYCKIIRRKHVGEWGFSEIENPPMEIGVEYRTTERYKGEPVYVTVVDCLTFVAGTEVTWTEETVSKIVRAEANIADIIPMTIGYLYGDVRQGVFVYGNKIEMLGEAPGYINNLYVTIYYTKS